MEKQERKATESTEKIASIQISAVKIFFHPIHPRRPFGGKWWNYSQFFSFFSAAFLVYVSISIACRATFGLYRESHLREISQLIHFAYFCSSDIVQSSTVFDPLMSQQHINNTTC